MLAAAAAFAVLAGVLVTVLATRDAGSAAAAPVVGPNTLVRIDPKTNAVSKVIDVGARPYAVVASGQTVWVYNDGDSNVYGIDGRTNAVSQRTRITGKPVDLGLLTGPVLAADRGGAWIIGVDSKHRALLTRVRESPRGTRAYPLDREPRAVAVGQGGVWVLGRGKSGYEVQRIDPATGRPVARARFPLSARLSSLGVGLGAAWVVSSPTATLYRLDPRTARVTRQVDLGHRAGRPDVQFGNVWVAISDLKGMTVLVNPRTLEGDEWLDCCPLGDGTDFIDGSGSTWQTDWATGTVVRYDGVTHDIVKSIRITAPPFYGGDCVSSIATGAGAAWVTVTRALEYACPR